MSASPPPGLSGACGAQVCHPRPGAPNRARSPLPLGASPLSTAHLADHPCPCPLGPWPPLPAMHNGPLQVCVGKWVWGLGGMCGVGWVRACAQESAQWKVACACMRWQLKSLLAAVQQELSTVIVDLL